MKVFSAANRHQRIQRMIALGILFFLFCLIGTLIYRVGKKPSLLGTPLQEGRGGGVGQGLEVGENLRSAISIHDFHRVVMKDGRPYWEIRARDANYLTDQGLAYVTDALLTMHQSEKLKSVLKSRSGRLILDGQELVKAEFEGEVVFRHGDSLTLKTELAALDTKEQLVKAPGKVLIEGSGYSISGMGMEAQIENQVLTLLSNVESEFRGGANLPKTLNEVTKKQ